MVDQILSICYDPPVLDCFRRVSLRAVSLERRCSDAEKRIPRNIDAWHEGMEIHRGRSENVNVERACCSRPFSFKKTSSLQAPRAISPYLPVWPSTFSPLVLVFLSRILTLTPLVCFELERVSLCLLRFPAYHHEECLFAINQFDHEKTVGFDEAFPRIQSWFSIQRGQASSYSAQQKVFVVLQTIHEPALR